MITQFTISHERFNESGASKLDIANAVFQAIINSDLGKKTRADILNTNSVRVPVEVTYLKDGSAESTVAINLVDKAIYPVGSHCTMSGDVLNLSRKYLDRLRNPQGDQLELEEYINDLRIVLQNINESEKAIAFVDENLTTLKDTARSILIDMGNKLSVGDSLYLPGIFVGLETTVSLDSDEYMTVIHSKSARLKPRKKSSSNSAFGSIASVIDAIFDSGEKAVDQLLDGQGCGKPNCAECSGVLDQTAELRAKYKAGEISRHEAINGMIKAIKAIKAAKEQPPVDHVPDVNQFSDAPQATAEHEPKAE